jgi:hypothetical protein
MQMDASNSQSVNAQGPMYESLDPDSNATAERVKHSENTSSGIVWIEQKTQNDESAAQP